jgi:peptidoglycan hydrolase-like protein with peptidoglycan-binding domain
MTATALKEFQAKHGLEADGNTNPETFAAIDAALAKL